MTNKARWSISTFVAPYSGWLNRFVARRLPAMFLVFGAASAFSQDVYRWVGEDGKVHYSDEPPAAARRVERKVLNPSKTGSDNAPAESLPAVALYTAQDCDDSGCKSARDFLARRSVPYVEKAIKTADDFAEYQKATGGSEGIAVPMLLVGQKWQKGFQENSWNLLLDAAGYAAAK